MTWILIYTVLAFTPNSVGGVAVTTGTVEFNNQLACAQAARGLIEMSDHDTHFNAKCVPKG